MSTLQKNHDKARAIERAADNGDRLTPEHYQLVEWASLGVPLSPEKQMELDGLYKKLPEYTPPFLHGVEHITIDHKGTVYYKGVEVDVTAPVWAATLGARADALRLQDQCRYLESRGIQPCIKELMFNWGAHSKGYFERKKAQLAALVPEGTQITLSYVFARGENRESVELLLPGEVGESEVVAHPVYQDTVGGPPCSIEIETYCYGHGQPQPATQEQCDVVSHYFFTLRDLGVLEQTGQYQYGQEDKKPPVALPAAGAFPSTGTNKEFYHGLRDLTYRDGLICYKGQPVSETKPTEMNLPSEKRRAMHIWEMCRYLESIGVAPSSITGDEHFYSCYGQGFLEVQRARLNDIVRPDHTQITYTVVTMDIENSSFLTCFLMPGKPDLEQIRQSDAYRDELQGRTTLVKLSCHSYRYGNGPQQRAATPREIALLDLCLNKELNDAHLLKWYSYRKVASVTQHTDESLDDDEPLPF